MKEISFCSQVVSWRLWFECSTQRQVQGVNRSTFLSFVRNVARENMVEWKIYT